MTMMVFITHCLKKSQFECFIRLMGVALLVVGMAGMAHAQSPVSTPDATLLKFEKLDDALWLSTQLKFELPPAIEDALQKGIAIFFVAEAELMRERWYWRDKKIATMQRHTRLAYQPLTRRWRVNMASGEITDPVLSLNQNYESLPDALAAVQRIYRWRIADAQDIDPGVPHFVTFRFQLDLMQLPRPLQIGTLWQSDWSISLSTTQPLNWASL